MKKWVKISSCLLSLLLLFSACGKPEPTENSTSAPGESAQNTDSAELLSEVQLPFNETDGVNPFFAKSYENLYLSRLLYESLFTVSAGFEAIPEIANNININGNTATIGIKSGVSCHGSAPINPADVVYSFNMAKNSYAYAGALESIESAQVSGNSVVFTSKFTDMQIALKLTFPVVKEKTAENRSDIPLGSGKYYFYENSLISSDGSKPTVLLVSTSTKDTAMNAYKIGNTDVFFSDLADCNYTQIYGNESTANLNNMIYLGLSSERGALDKNIRSAIAVLINSADVAESAYQGHAVPSKFPCNPSSVNYSICEKTGISLSGDEKIGKQIIDRCGYTRYAGKALTNGAYVLSFSLIVNGDSKYRVAAAYSIADTLNAAGFYIEVKVLTFEDYSERISSGNYDMYLGEVKLDLSMDLSAFFSEDGALSKGTYSVKVSDEYFKMRSGGASYEDFIGSFIESYPFVPVAFRSGSIFSSNDFKADLSHFPCDLYYGL